MKQKLHYFKHYIFAGILILGLFAQAGLLMPYHKMALKDLDVVTEMIRAKTIESKKSSNGKVVPLKEALQALYIRPDSDAMISKVITPLRTALDALDAWEKVHTELVTEAINALTNPRAFKPDIQVSYLIFLDNVLNELKPYVKNNGFEANLVRKIAESKFEVTSAARSEMKLRLMKEIAPTQEKAFKILGQVPPTPAEPVQ